MKLYRNYCDGCSVGVGASPMLRVSELPILLGALLTLSVTWNHKKSFDNLLLVFMLANVSMSQILYKVKIRKLVPHTTSKSLFRFILYTFIHLYFVTI